jgi:hypothetical protein
MFFILSIGITLGMFIGYTFREDIQGIVEVHELFERDKNIRNTVVPESLEAYLPKGWLSWLETAKFVAEMGVLYADQWFRRTCQPYRDGLYRVRFTIDEKLYALLVRPVRGPDEYIVNDEDNDTDVSEHWQPFLRGQRAVITALTPKLVGDAKIVRLVSIREPELSRLVQADEPIIVGPS